MPVLTKINTNVIADNAVTAAKLPAGAVDADIGTGAVGTSELAAGAVTGAKIGYLGDGSGEGSEDAPGNDEKSGKDDDDIVDADFEEVKKSDK